MDISTIGKNFKGKKILVTGGTGSFGRQVVSQLVNFKPNRISIFSRDEKKQFDMRNEFEEHGDLLEFVIGDVRDPVRVHEATRDIDIVYHAAALKQIPSCELHPYEAVKTNVIGAENVRIAAIENGVGVVVAISTDKAVKPINVMGMTKAIQEKIMLNPNNRTGDTRFLCVRYGNVIGSRGSVIPLFKQRIEEGKSLPITSNEMTRFLLRLQEAVHLIFKATIEGSSGQLFVKKMPACYIKDLAGTMAKEMTGREDYPIEEIGIRPGEKIHEVLVSEEEMQRAVETEGHYVIHYYEELKESVLITDLKEYTSDRTHILKGKELISLLKKDGWI